MAIYNVLIVDDEAFIRERLIEFVPWEDYAMTVLGEAVDGSQAIEMASRLRPDIVITDIRMPGLSGLEMIERIQRVKPDIKWIILSGFGEFEYARKAIQLGVSEFLLKPTEPGQLLEALTRVTDELNQERKREVERNRFQSYTSTARDQMIQELVAGNHPGYGWEEEAQHIGLRWIVDEPIRLALISMPYSLMHQDRKLVEVTQFAVHNVLFETVETHESMCLVRVSRGRWVLVFGGRPSGEEELDRFLRRLSHNVMNYTKVPIFIYVSESSGQSLDISRLYWEVEKAAEYEGQDTACPIRYIPSSGELHAYAHWQQPMQQLAAWIKQGEVQALQQWLSRIEQPFMAWDLTSAQRWCFEWLLSLHEELFVPDSDHPAYDVLHHELRTQISAQYKNKELFQLFNLRLHKLIQQRNGGGTHHLIRKAMDIIRLTFTQNIQLTHVAEELQISAVYLSDLFKKETGITFREHIMQLRMKEAAHRLQSSTMKVYEVSYYVGYNKVEHFVKLFKKYYGMTPTEYRGGIV